MTRNWIATSSRLSSEVPVALPGETPPNSARAVSGPDVYRSTTEGCSQAWASEVTSIPARANSAVYQLAGSASHARCAVPSSQGGRYLANKHRAEAVEDGQDVLIVKVPHGHPRIDRKGALRRPERNCRRLWETNC